MAHKDENKTNDELEKDIPDALSETTIPVGEDIGGVGLPHFQSAEDVWRILPCEVQFVGETEWLVLTKVEKVSSKDPRVVDSFLYTTEDGNIRSSHTAGNPLKVRTAATGAHKVK